MLNPLQEIGHYFENDALDHMLRQMAVAQSNLAPGCVYCHVVPWKAPLRPKRCSSGFSSSVNKPQPPTATLLLSPITNQFRSAVSMYRRGGAWHFRPEICKSLDSDGFFVRIEGAWAEVLCRLVSQTIDPLLQFAPPQKSSVSGIETEVRARLARFEYRGPFHFFQNSGHALAWLVSYSWQNWTDAEVPVEDRLRHLQQYVYNDLDSIDLHKLLPEAVVRQLSNQQFQPRQVQWKRRDIAVKKEGNPNDIFFKMRVADALKSMSSKRESQDITRVNKDIAKATKENGAAFFTSAGIWWWRQMLEYPGMLPYFLDDWEESAFFYVFRARKIASTSKPPVWDWFSVPWIDLDHTQKAILYHLCAPADQVSEDHIGTKRNHKPIYVKIDLNRSLDRVLGDVEKLWARKEKSSAASNLKLHSRWTLLESMDLRRYFDQNPPQLEKAERVTLKREEGKYVELCRIAGVDQ